MLIDILFQVFLACLLIFGILMTIIGFVFIKDYTHFKIDLMRKEMYTNLTNQIQTINELLDLIDNQINVEIAHKLRAEYTLGERYNPLNMDKDCVEISNRVYNSITKSVFINIDHVMPIYNDDFWMHYITKKTTCLMLSATRALEPQ